MRTLRADPEVANLAAAKIKALAHPLRLRIVAVLSETETHVNALAGELSVPQSVVSQHLRDVVHRAPRFCQSNGKGVTQVMDAKRGASCSFQNFSEEKDIFGIKAFRQGKH